MQLTIELSQKADIELVMALLERLGAKVISSVPSTPSAVGWLDKVADAGGIASIADPVAWQREERKDRTLVGREL